MLTYAIKIQRSNSKTKPSGDTRLIIPVRSEWMSQLKLVMSCFIARQFFELRIVSLTVYEKLAIFIISWLGLDRAILKFGAEEVTAAARWGRHALTKRQYDSRTAWSYDYFRWLNGNNIPQNLKLNFTSSDRKGSICQKRIVSAHMSLPSIGYVCEYSIRPIMRLDQHALWDFTHHIAILHTWCWLRVCKSLGTQFQSWIIEFSMLHAVLGRFQLSGNQSKTDVLELHIRLKLGRALVAPANDKSLHRQTCQGCSIA
jgi:hypothetical protein